MPAVAAVLVFATAWLLLFLDVEPVPTWFYVLAWYPVLVLADHVVRRRRGASVLFSSPTRAASLFGWSAIVWLVFEVANFRLRNWYYVFLPDTPFERWAGILISFATVLPAVVVAERLLEALGVGHGWRSPPFPVRPRDFRVIQLLGLGMLGLALALPRTFFPLIWGAAWLIADPFVLRRRPEWSLLGDASRGTWGRIGRLMLGGLAIGLVWEFLNFWARGKWVYTVPWLEGTKLFEMPPLGFLGFPFFALEAWAMYHAVCAVGLGVGWQGAGSGERDDERSVMREGSSGTEGSRRVIVVLAAAAFAVATLVGMERWTISSVTPRLEEIPGITPPEREALETIGLSSPFAIARADPDTIASRAWLLYSRASQIVERSRLVVLRGLGTTHAARLDALGVTTVCALARRPPAVLWRAYHALDAPQVPRTVPGPNRPTPAEVRVWVGAARRTCADAWSTD